MAAGVNIWLEDELWKSSVSAFVAILDFFQIHGLSKLLYFGFFLTPGCSTGLNVRGVLQFIQVGGSTDLNVRGVLKFRKVGGSTGLNIVKWVAAKA